MNTLDIFETNCRATSSLVNVKNKLLFKELTSGINNKNKNGEVARFQFDEFFIDLYFIENGPLAYAPNTIWVSVGFDSYEDVPFSIYDILNFIEPKNFKCYTYSYLYTKEVIIEAFGEINDLFKKIVPTLTEIAKNGVQKNKLIDSQKQLINKFVTDDIFKPELEIMDAQIKIRNMLIRNFMETEISHAVVGSVSEFFKGNKNKAIKKYKASKLKTPYEIALFTALSNGELDDFDPSPFRNEQYKNYTSVAKKRTYTFGINSVMGLLIPCAILTPILSIVILFLSYILSYTLFKDASFYISNDLYTLLASLFSGLLFSYVITLHSSKKIMALFQKIMKKKRANMAELVIDSKPSKFLKYFSIILETIAIIFIFTSVNSNIAIYNDYLTHSSSVIALNQTKLSYKYVETVYKVSGFDHFISGFIDYEYYIFETKTGEKIRTFGTAQSTNEEIEATLLPRLIENGVSVTEIKTEQIN